MIEIELTQGYKSVIDNEDYELVKNYKWHVFHGHAGVKYAATKIRINNRKTTLFLHRLLLGLKHGDRRKADHKDLNGLNNTRDNLRICNNVQSNQNRGKQKRTRSGFKGVYIDKSKYRVNVNINGKLIHIGMFDNPIDAARAYDEQIIRHYGEFAKTNKMLGLLP